MGPPWASDRRLLKRNLVRQHLAPSAALLRWGESRSYCDEDGRFELAHLSRFEALDSCAPRSSWVMSDVLETTSTPAPRTAGQASPRIGICLSGGGFRASAFGFGVVRYFVEAGLAPHIRAVSAVSGGSITAAMLAEAWPAVLDDHNEPVTTLLETAIERFRRITTTKNVRNRGSPSLCRPSLAIRWPVWLRARHNDGEAPVRGQSSRRPSGQSTGHPHSYGPRRGARISNVPKLYRQLGPRIRRNAKSAGLGDSTGCFNSCADAVPAGALVHCRAGTKHRPRVVAYGRRHL